MPYRRLPSLLALRAFESLARRGSIKQAAEELNVTSGAVSQMVKKLEAELDCQLTVRRNRRLELTPVGVRLNIGLADAFLRLREAVEGVRPLSDSNTLIVATGPPLAAKWLAPRMAAFLERLPDADIRITSSFTKLDYAEHHIDVGIRLSNDDDPALERVWLGEETMMPLASPAYIEAQRLRVPRDLLRVPLLYEDVSQHFPHTSSWPDWFATAGLPRESAMRGVNFGEYHDQALDAAIIGAGVVLGRKVIASRDIADGRLVCPFGPELVTGLNYQIVCRKDRKHTPLAMAFQEWVAEELMCCLGMDVLP